MTSENQALLNAIRVVVREEITPLNQRVDGLGEQIQRVEIEQREQRILLQSIDLRLTNIEARVERLEGHVQRLEDSVETLDTRTSQISSDLLDLKDRVRNGLRALKRESELALRKISELPIDYRTHRNRIDELEDRVNLLQQRLDRLEGSQSE
jgi:predicted RNase H-like nuclease (RuvC/YqgF family)